MRASHGLLVLESKIPIHLSLIALFLSLVMSCVNKKDEADRPNVLFILVDDLGWKDLSAAGSSFYETPSIDSLYEDGFVFTQGYSSSRVCSPSRASIMTGKFTARHGITDWIGAAEGEAWRNRGRENKLLPAFYNHHLSSDETTIAEAFLENHYKTFFAGKWHLGDEGNYPEDHGFQVNKGGWEKGSPIGGFYAPWENPSLPFHHPGESLTKRLAAETISFIEENQDSSFFAFLSFYAVHAPIQTEKSKWEKYRNKAIQTGAADSGFTMERILPIRRNQDNPVYAGLVETMDEAVGNVLNTLDRLGLKDNTIVVFTSDNGGVASGDAYATSNMPLRGGKGYQWEGGVREPFVIYVPWLESTSNKKIETPVINTDFYPTLLDLCGLDLYPDQHKDGVSLKPLLYGDKINDRPLYWHYPHYGNQGGEPSSVIRKGKWKLIHYYEDDHNELYNLDSDPEEQHDVSSENLDLTDRLWYQLSQWLEENDAKYPIQDPQYDSARYTAKLNEYKTSLLSDLEARRKKMLSPDYEPNPDWWGSFVVED